MVINYKKLNDNTVFDGYYIPNKTILFNRIQGASWFSKMDCKSEYWQIKTLNPFYASQGHYEWIVMPFGLKNAPQIFQRRLDNIFKDLNHCSLVYINDILVFFFLNHRTAQKWCLSSHPEMHWSWHYTW